MIFLKNDMFEKISQLEDQAKSKYVRDIVDKEMKTLKLKKRLKFTRRIIKHITLTAIKKRL